MYIYFVKIGLLLAFFTLLGFKSSEAKVWELGKLATDTDFTNLLAEVAPFDTVIVDGAEFSTSFQIRKPIMLIGKNNASFNAKGEAKSLLVLFADSIKVQGFMFKNVAPSYTKEVAAILLKPSKGSVIQDNKIDSCFFGIYIEYGDNHKILRNKIVGHSTNEAQAGNAIHVWKAKNLQIANNYVASHRDGIYFEFVDDSEITSNYSEQNLRYGLHFMFSNRDSYSGNTFINNGTGVAVMFSRKIKMIGNHFTDNWGGSTYGLLLKEISDGLISGNSFVHNTTGVLAEGANRIQFISNLFSWNGTAIDMKGNCIDNKIHRNDFIANIFEVVTNSNRNNNEYSLNYWSQHESYDLNKDTYADTAYRPVNLFSKIIHEIPAASLLIHSFISDLFVLAERLFPDLIPPLLIDNNPKFKPYGYAFN